jgi:hypothetical protein
MSENPPSRRAPFVRVNCQLSIVLLLQLVDNVYVEQLFLIHLGRRSPFSSSSSSSSNSDSTGQPS